MNKYKVEMTEKENTYCYTGEWDSDFYSENYIEAENEDEAIEFAKNYLNENGSNADDYIFRINEYMLEIE